MIRKQLLIPLFMFGTITLHSSFMLYAVNPNKPPIDFILGSPNYDLYQSVKAKNFDEVELLLSTGANPNTINPFTQESALQIAALQGSTAIVYELLRAGADVAHYNFQYSSPALHRAADHGYTAIAVMLLDAGASMGERNYRGQTALSYAVLSGNLETVHIMLSKNATDINATNFNGSTPLAYAILNNDINMVELLLNYGAEITSIYNNRPLIYHARKINRYMASMMNKYNQHKQFQRQVLQFSYY